MTDDATWSRVDPLAINGAAAHDSYSTCDLSHVVDLGRWTVEPDAMDLELFVDPCSGPTLDVGCGPGRLSAALAARHIETMGIDIAEDAVRLARSRGAQAVRRDVFADGLGNEYWQHVLLADGNIGIGGDPVALLTRIRHVMAPTGEIIAEVGEPGTGITYEQQRLQIGDQVTEPFPWAVVGMDAVDKIAGESGLRLDSTRSVGNRHVVTLVRD